jgi:hypothetical protein
MGLLETFHLKLTEDVDTAVQSMLDQLHIVNVLYLYSTSTLLRSTTQRPSSQSILDLYDHDR